MYDTIGLSKTVEHIVVQGDAKKYYRFRPTGFYGGIATADTVGCNLRCAFCWSSNSVWNASTTGSFYSSKEVAHELKMIAKKKGYHQLRVSGGEPTIGKHHLLSLLDHVGSEHVFILETNGILLGYDESYVKDLSHFENLHVRVCLKGCNKKEFQMFTDADPLGFEYQLHALDSLRRSHISFNIALVTTKDHSRKQELFHYLQTRELGNIMIEEEEIKLYPHVRKRLKDKGMLSYFE